MFFLLSKFLNFIFTPIGILSLLLFYGIFTKYKTRQRKCLIFAFCFLFIFSNPFIVNELMLMTEVNPTPISQVQPHAIGIVLTGGITNDDKLPAENTFLGICADRLGQAIQLYKMKKIDKILISGGSINILGTQPKQESSDAKKYLLISGVNEADILLDTLSKNTRENAIYSSQILKKSFANQTYILITSGLHLGRATKCFEKIGVKVTPYGANYFSHERQFIPAYILPKEDYFKYSEWLFHEWIGNLTYWILGYI